MGKARILSAQGEGLYSIEILEDRTRAEAARTTAVQRVAQIDARITDLESELTSAQSDVDVAVADQDQTIADYQAALQDDSIDTAAARQAMTDAGEAVLQAAAQRDAVRGAIRAAKAERLTLQARIERIDALPPLRQVSAWCADYVEDLSGEVATAEVPGEIGQVIIKPGFSDGAAWSPSEDGAIQPALSGTPASVFYNLAMMPGWQKWRPTFRIATISNIDNDLCDITLDAATSSQQGLNVNAQGGYSGVPIYYMDCNGGAFEDGDRVLVAFSGNTDQPMVVGFEQEPKECSIVVVFELDVKMVISASPMQWGSWGPGAYDRAGQLTSSLIPWGVKTYSLESSGAAAYRAKDVLPFEDINNDIPAEWEVGGYALGSGWFSSEVFDVINHPSGGKYVIATPISDRDEPIEGWTSRCPILNDEVVENGALLRGVTFEGIVRSIYQGSSGPQDPLRFEFSISHESIQIFSAFRVSEPDLYSCDNSFASGTISGRPYTTSEVPGLQFEINISDLPSFILNETSMQPKKVEGAKDVGGRPTCAWEDAAFEGRILIAVTYGRS